MATTPRARTQTRAAASARKRPPAQPQPGLRDRARTRWDDRFAGQLLSDDTRRQIMGAVPIALGLIFAWVLMSHGRDGRVAGWAYDALRGLAGNGAFLIPIFLIMGGIKAFFVAAAADPVLLVTYGASAE